MQEQSEQTSLKQYAWIPIAVLGGLASALHAEQLFVAPWLLGLLVIGFLLLSSLGLAVLLKKAGYNRVAEYRWCEAMAMLPMLLPFVLLLIRPIIFTLSTYFSFSVAGFVRFPWMTEGIKLSTEQYFMLLGFGAGWLGTGLLRLLFWLRALYSLFAEAKIKQPGVWLTLTALAGGLWLQGWAAAIYPPTGDEVHYLLMATSFVEDGDFDLKNQFAQQEWKVDYPSETLDFHGHPDAAGRWICRHMPVLSLLILPAYMFNGPWWAAAMNILILALALWLLYGFARDLGAEPKQAYFMYALAVLVAPWTIWGYLIYPVAAGILLILMACRLLLRLEQWQAALWLGVVSCLLPWFHHGFGIAGMLLLAVGMWHMLWRKRWKSLSAMILAGLTVGLPFVWVFLTFYQEALASGDYAFTFRAHFFINAMLGQLVDRNYGILTAAPVLLSAWAGLTFLKQDIRKWILVFLLGMPFLCALQAALFVDWTGFSAGFSRLLAPVCAPLFAGLAFMLPQEKKLLRATWVLGIWSVLVSLSTWVLPILLYEMPKMKMLPALAARGVPPVWQVFPYLKAETSWWVTAWGVILVVGAGVLTFFLYQWKRLEQQATA
ncbi:hypothetical protein KAR34_01225 [bacterium]|nr:hypothetical protein [bacterium]